MKHTKIIVLFILLLTVSFALCACDLFGGNNSTDNDGGNHGTTEYVKDSYEYPFTIGDDEFKYVFNFLYTENDQYAGGQFILYFNDVVLLDEGASSLSVEGDRLHFADATFIIGEDKTLAYESGSYFNLPWIIQPYDSLAGTYTMEEWDEYQEQYVTQTLVLSADGTATYSAADGVSFHYYPLGKGSFDIALVSDLNNRALIISLPINEEIHFDHNNIFVSDFTPEFISSVYDVMFTGKEYWGGEGYFINCSLYVAEGKCLLTGYTFAMFDYTREGNTLITEEGDLVLNEENCYFDLKLVKKYESADKSTFINVYEDGYVYCNERGRCMLAETPEGFSGVAIYNYESDVTYVYDSNVNLTALIRDSEYADFSAMNKYTDADGKVIYVSGDFSKLYSVTRLEDGYDEIYVYNARKLQENILIDETEVCYFLFDNNFVVSHYSNLQYYSRIASATESTVQKIGIQKKWPPLSGDNDSMLEANEHTVCITLHCSNGDILIIEIDFVPNTSYLNEIYCENAVKVGDYYTNGKIFIKLGEEMIEFVEYEYSNEIYVDAVKDYNDGYITVVSGNRNFLFDVETAEYKTCIEDVFYAGFEGKEFALGCIINSDLSKIYVYSDTAHNTTVYAPEELTAVPQIEGLYSYNNNTDAIFVKQGETNQYYHAQNWYYDSNPAAPNSVDTYLNVKLIDFSVVGYSIVTVCHYDDHSEIYAYTVQDSIVQFHSGYGYSGAYAYDEASDTVTVTYEYDGYFHYVHTITNAKKTNPDADICYSVEIVQVQ